MDKKNEKSCITNDRFYPIQFSPEIRSNQDSSIRSTDLEKCNGNCLDVVNSIKVNSHPTTTRNTSKMHISTDEDTNFDIFDFMKCPDDEGIDCDKDVLSLNEDLVTKYENNLESDIIRNKDICWAAGNFENEVCPLRNYDTCNENSLFSFTRDSLDGCSRESFPQEWTFEDSLDYVSQDQVQDPHLIIPKKTVDITKIKGWKKKQFTEEKCLSNRNSILRKANTWEKWNESREQDIESGTERDHITGEDQNKDYAFVCDKLDDFLDQEAELKINYEIPHLYAECGIKLTSEELVSRPKFNLTTLNNKLPVENLKIVKTEKPTSDSSICLEEIKIEEKESSALVKKASPKMKFAFPSKSHKNWSLWKENNVRSKGKPMSLLKKEVKREITTEVIQPCRRSGRISQAAVNKTDGGGCPVVNENDIKPMNALAKPISDFNTNYKFEIRKFGMVLYPGPSAPLNPFITYHLQKIRSYRTEIDKNWANFAVSAVVQKGKAINRKRMVLPVTCCFKYKKEPSGILPCNLKCETDPISENSLDIKDFPADVKVAVDDEKFDKKVEKKVNQDNNNVFSEDITEKTKIGGKKKLSAKRESAAQLPLITRINEVKCDLYEEEVKCEDYSKDEINIDSNSIDIVSDHLNNYSDDSNFDSDKCEIIFEKRRSKTSITKCIKENLPNLPEVIDIEDDGTEFSTTIGLSHNPRQNAFHRIIARLLAKKLNELKQTGNIASSIDKLKTVKQNALELIKLNFIKENYLSGYINLWYLKSPDTGKSRIFLTFSMNPPVERARNLKMISRYKVGDPPNIIKEIIAKDKFFDTNDFAILYCDGSHWEIHGSVNFVMNKCEGEKGGNEKIQVFHLTKKVFQELEMLHDIKQKNDKNRVLKWWVMHMMQDYTEITVRCGDQVGRITRSIIMKTWKSKVPNFIHFKGLRNTRPIGVGVNPRLWPYFLIGPYHMGDHHNLTLKLNSRIIPFEYYLPLDRVNPAFLLKRFVSSVIMHSWRNCRQVVGMWLYDRIAMNQGSFIQVRTRMKKSRNYEPVIEHDYSINKSKEGLFESMKDTRKIAPHKRKSTKQEVFLVPNVPNLGYIKGELHSDRSITIQHPLKPERKWNSQRIGDWLNRIMKKRIKFIPNDFHVRWKIVKKAKLNRNLEPLNRSTLGGTHILCKKGVFYLLSLTKEKIAKLGLNESVVLDAILNNPIIQEVAEMKELGKILVNKDTCDLSMADILQMALSEIEKLEKEEKYLKSSRLTIEKERELLCRKYLETLDNSDMDENSKRTINFYVTGILESCKIGDEKIEDLKKEKENCLRLEAINKFLQNIHFSTSRKNSGNSDVPSLELKDKEKSHAENFSISNPSDGLNEENIDLEVKSQSDNEKFRELESKIKSLHESLNKMVADDVNLRELLTKKLNAMSEHLEKMKKSHNTNGKLSPLIKEEIDFSNAQGSYCSSSPKLYPSMDKDYPNFTYGSHLKNDINPQKNDILEVDIGKLISKKCNSEVPLTEDLIKIKTQKALTRLKNYVQEGTAGLHVADESKETENKSGENMADELLRQLEFGGNRRNSELENSVDVEREGEKLVIVKQEKPEVEESSQAKVETHLKAWKSSLNDSEEGTLRNIEKRVCFELIRPISLADAKTKKKLKGRIVNVLTNGKQVLLVNKKRKRAESGAFMKKLRAS